MIRLIYKLFSLLKAYLKVFKILILTKNTKYFLKLTLIYLPILDNQCYFIRPATQTISDLEIDDQIISSEPKQIHSLTSDFYIKMKSLIQLTGYSVC